MRKYGLINSETVRLPLVDLSEESKSLLDSYKLKEHIDTVYEDSLQKKLIFTQVNHSKKLIFTQVNH